MLPQETRNSQLNLSIGLQHQQQQQQDENEILSISHIHDGCPKVEMLWDELEKRMQKWTNEIIVIIELQSNKKIVISAQIARSGKKYVISRMHKLEPLLKIHLSLKNGLKKILSKTTVLDDFIDAVWWRLCLSLITMSIARELWHFLFSLNFHLNPHKFWFDFRIFDQMVEKIDYKFANSVKK